MKLNKESEYKSHRRQPGWEGIWWTMDTYVFMAESLQCLPETITALLLIRYIPIQNKKFFKKKKKKRVIDFPVQPSFCRPLSNIIYVLVVTQQSVSLILMAMPHSNTRISFFKDHLMLFVLFVF